MTTAPRIGATMGRALMIAVAAAAVLLAMPAMAGAQDDAPYPPPKITVENPAVTVTIEGDDWGPGTVVTITRNDANSASAQSTGVEVLGTATVRPDGTFSFAADGLAPGDDVTVSGTAADGSERVDTLVVTQERQAQAVGSQIARTGVAVWQAILIAAALLVAGGVLTVVARRRASSTA